MRKLIYCLLGLVVILALSYSVLYFLFPDKLVEAGINSERQQAGLSLKHIQVGDHDIQYLHGGLDGAPVILMVHGYSANKDNWTRFAKHFVDRYQIIIPDLPGFGDSSHIEAANYDIDHQRDRLLEFAQALKLPRFHIVGNSMGGWIAGALALKHPDEILSLGLFNSAGVDEPVLSPRSKAWLEGKNILLIEGPEDIDRAFGLVFQNPPAMPQIAKEYLARQALKQKDFNVKVAQDLLANPLDLEAELASIQTPSLVLWGDNDRVIDVSTAEVFKNGLPNATTIIMEDTGHLPMLEHPSRTAKHYQQFLHTISGQ